MVESKSSVHVYNCSLSSSEMINFSPEIRTASRKRNYNNNNNKKSQRSWIHGCFQKIWVAMLLAPPPSLPTMAFCGELAALFILKTMKYGLKVTDAVICLYCLLPCLDQTAWCELYNLLSPICHHPSSFFGNKATWKSTSHFLLCLFHILWHDATLGTREKK